MNKRIKNNKQTLIIGRAGKGRARYLDIKSTNIIKKDNLPNKSK